MQDATLLGFYALANGQAELSSAHQKRLGSRRPTQPAVVLTQIARHVDAPPGTGQVLLRDAFTVAQEASRRSAATILALDPYDGDTAEMWRRRYSFLTSRMPVRPGGDLKRLWVPLQAD